MKHLVQLDTTRPGAYKDDMFTNTSFVQPDSAARSALASTNGAKWRHPDVPGIITDFSAVSSGTGSITINFTPISGGGGSVPTYDVYNVPRRELIAENISPNDTITCPTGIQYLVVVAINDSAAGHVSIISNEIEVNVIP